MTAENTKETEAGEACTRCGCVISVEMRPGRRDRTNLTSVAMNPEPAPDVRRIHCAGCGLKFWEDDDL